MKTTTFICQFSELTQQEIRKDIISYLTNEGYADTEIAKITENAMSGRLVDLEENLDISKYIKMEIENLLNELCISMRTNYNKESFEREKELLSRIQNLKS